MTDKVHPSAKPAANGGTPTVSNGGTTPTFPANKTQFYKADRPAYRPQPPLRRRHRRSCCCACCLWTTILTIVILLLAAPADAVFYVLYRPHRPSLSVSSLQLSRFNLTDTAINSDFNFTLIARNPNSKITFFYNPIAVRILSGDVDIGNGSFPAFAYDKKNVTTLRTVVSSSVPFPDGTDVSTLRLSLRSRNLPLTIQSDTKIKSEKDLSGWSVLDVGTGNGSLLQELSKQGFMDLAESDYTEAAIDRARNLADRDGSSNIKFTVDDVLDTKLNRKFELVTDKGTLDAIGLHPDGPIKSEIENRDRVPVANDLSFRVGFTGHSGHLRIEPLPPV